MSKRIISAFLAFVMTVLLLPIAAPQASAVKADFLASQECIDVIKTFEGFSAKPYWDNGHYTVGYGTTPLNDDDLERYKAEGISKEEAEELLEYYVNTMGSSINSFIKKYNLVINQGQFDALLSFTYNCGVGWLYKESTIRTAIIEGKTGNDLIFAFGQWSNVGTTILTGKVKRRLIEANMYLNGVYSMTVPSNYCYVLFDANGGSSDVRVQGYDSNVPVAPIAIGTYEGYIFEGWYTEPDGGTQITLLTADTRNDRLYAHWSVDENYDPSNKEDADSGDGVKVTVTGNNVNIRSGPGTGYKIVDNVDSGKTMTITETATGSGYTWGKFSGGWIALKYTNYDEAVKEETQKPDTTEPTQPTEPEEETPSVSVKGTITGDELRIRKGPSTGYGIVGYLNTGDRVEILEQKTVGAMAWGRIAQGWISMDYVKLDGEAEEEKPTEPEATQPTEPEATKPTEPEATKPTEPEATKPTEPENTTISGKVKVTSGSLRIRAGAGTSYATVGYYSNGTAVKILEKKTVGTTVWGRTDKGWISMDYVTVTGNEPAQPETYTGTIKANSRLRIRSGAGTNYSIVGYVSNGTKVTILERKTVDGDEWGRISQGWISMDHVVLDAVEKPSQETQLKGTIDADIRLRVRSGPGTSYSIVGYLNRGTQVVILETKTVNGDTWGRTSQGWISMDHVKLEGNNSASNGTVTGSITANTLRIRQGAGTSYTIVGYLYNGAKVEILEVKTVNGEQWGRISKGWISMDHVKLN